MSERRKKILNLVYEQYYTIEGTLIRRLLFYRDIDLTLWHLHREEDRLTYIANQGKISELESILTECLGFTDKDMTEIKVIALESFSKSLSFKGGDAEQE